MVGAFGIRLRGSRRAGAVRRVVVPSGEVFDELFDELFVDAFDELFVDAFGRLRAVTLRRDALRGVARCTFAFGMFAVVFGAAVRVLARARRVRVLRVTLRVAPRALRVVVEYGTFTTRERVVPTRQPKSDSVRIAAMNRLTAFFMFPPIAFRGGFAAFF
jgi:hypothetical protein